jgi:hypothetical protein
MTKHTFESVIKAIEKNNLEHEELIKLRNKLCPHNYVEHHSEITNYYCNEYYPASCTCIMCGLHADESDPDLYNFLYDKYKKTLK